MKVAPLRCPVLVVLRITRVDGPQRGCVATFFIIFCGMFNTAFYSVFFKVYSPTLSYTSFLCMGIHHVVVLGLVVMESA